MTDSKRAFMPELVLEDLKERHIDAVYQQRQQEASSNRMGAGRAKRRAMQLESEIRLLEYGY